MKNIEPEINEQSEQTNNNPAALLSAWCGEVQCFRELEGRIAGLPTEQLRGSVFECFAQAHLAVADGVAAKCVWPADRVPESIRGRFNGALDRDRGIDGVLNTRAGDLHAYQVKFRTNRPALSWSELSTFVGLTEEFDGRLVFTNSDEVASIVTNRRGLYSITGRNLDRLTAKDFLQIKEVLEGRKVAFSVLPPLLHQNTALKDICTELEVQDRATAVLACGTGKTLIASWTARRLKARRVLVLLPSLALVRQTLQEWGRVLPPDSFVWQCVCSDQTVDAGTDSWMLRQEDLDFPVTTDPAEVRRFLDCDFPGTKLVISTYQSAAVVAEGMDRSLPFDLGVFDEAHRTAGRQGLKFGFALADENLPIRKRLFMTATPRHYDIRKRTRGGDLAPVYSMDDPRTYGRVVHNLGVARAAERGIICPYKVVISVVTGVEVKVAQLRAADVVMDGEAANAADVANRLALARAVEHFGIRKLFTFHRSITAACAFASDAARGMGRFLSGFSFSHVNGAMPVSKRGRLLEEFKAAPMALMSNARCLTEGVNVPDVDMVAFLTPKRSRVDIVQAIGRALRKPQGKQYGYVFVPVLLQQGESIEAAVERTDFEHVWEVLQALREQDTVLADCIQLMSEDRGRGRGLDEAAFAERVEVLGHEIGLEALRRAITVACVNELGSTWDERYGQLLDYRQRHGDCAVPKHWPENTGLGGWVSTQRMDRRHGTLLPDREERLNQIEFDWNPDANAWQQRFDELVEFKRTQGHCNVPHLWEINPALGGWVAIQRRFRAQGRLKKDRVEKLDSIGLAWSPVDEFWEERFVELSHYAEVHGHCDVPQQWEPNRKLGTWVNTQRSLKQKGRLDEEKIRRLNELGFRWDPIREDWERMFEALVSFKEKHGHCRVPDKHEDTAGLSAWVATLRRQKKTGRLTEERLGRLEAVGFVWDAREAKWKSMLEQLRLYVEAHGDAEVPHSWPENRELAGWVLLQRQLKRKGKLAPERMEQLDALDFVWKPHATTWDEKLSQLKQLKQEGESCHWSKAPKLTKWLKHQLRLLKSGLLAPDRARRLQAVSNPEVLSPTLVTGGDTGVR